MKIKIRIEHIAVLVFIWMAVMTLNMLMLDLGYTQIDRNLWKLTNITEHVVNLIEQQNK